MTDATPSDASAAAGRLAAALADSDSSARLQVALTAGTRPDPAYVPVLVARCAVEPDFFVRDMLTWALMRHAPADTVPLLIGELRTGPAQARSQALHTLSKIGDPRGWHAITDELLQSPDDQVARSAWRAAVILVPAGSKTGLAVTLATQLGRGDRDVRRSLSRALAGLGEAADAVLEEAAEHGTDEIRIHAIATQRLARDLDEDFDASVFEAERIVLLMDVPLADPPPADDGPHPEP